MLDVILECFVSKTILGQSSCGPRCPALRRPAPCGKERAERLHELGNGQWADETSQSMHSRSLAPFEEGHHPFKLKELSRCWEGMELHQA